MSIEPLGVEELAVLRRWTEQVGYSDARLDPTTLARLIATIDALYAEVKAHRGTLDKMVTPHIKAQLEASE